MTGYDRTRDRTEPHGGHLVRALQRSYYRRNAWARNEPPEGVVEAWVDRNCGGHAALLDLPYLRPALSMRVRHRRELAVPPVYRAQLQVGIDPGPSTGTGTAPQP